MSDSLETLEIVDEQDSLKIIQFTVEINPKESYEMELSSVNKITFDI